MDKDINSNGFDYVDLELPSGTLWATCNVGANEPSDFGMYFQWGDTQGYTADQVGKESEKKKFRWADYKFSIDGNSSNFSKYTVYGSILNLEDDAAHVNMGGSWHMPSIDQIYELLNNTTNHWTTLDGVNGRLFTSKKDSSKSIFIPAAGYAWRGSVYGSGDNGCIWSSVLSTYNVSSGQNLGIYSGGAYIGSVSNRYYGFSVRGVIG